MNVKFVLLITLFSVFSIRICASSTDEEEIELGGNIGGKPILRSFSPVSDFVKAILNNQTVAVEFFQTDDDVTINITDESGDVVYSASAVVSPTSYHYIDMDSFTTGYYTIRIYNNSGVDISGTFWID